MVQCIWCSRQFTPREPSTENLYCLLSAGVAICWSCSDLYDEAEIKLHLGPIKARFDRTLTRVLTQSGHTLPLSVGSYERSRLPWGHWTGHAVDSTGKRWSLKGHNNHITFKPIGA